MFATTHLSDHVHDHMTFNTTPATKGLALCLDATLGIKAHRWVPANTHGTPMPAREGRGQPKSTTDDNDSTTRLGHFVEHLHGSGASSSNTYKTGIINRDTAQDSFHKCGWVKQHKCEISDGPCIEKYRLYECKGWHNVRLQLEAEVRSYSQIVQKSGRLWLWERGMHLLPQELAWSAGVSWSRLGSIKGVGCRMAP